MKKEEVGKRQEEPEGHQKKKEKLNHGGFITEAHSFSVPVNAGKAA